MMKTSKKVNKIELNWHAKIKKKKKTDYLFIYCVCFENGVILISSLFVQLGYGKKEKKWKRPSIVRLVG